MGVRRISGVRPWVFCETTKNLLNISESFFESVLEAGIDTFFINVMVLWLNGLKILREITLSSSNSILTGSSIWNGKISMINPRTLNSPLSRVLETLSYPPVTRYSSRPS